jgi:ankyrin repeat protein
LCSKGDIPVAETLLEYGADINSIDTEWCSTPLGWAARYGQKDMVEYLLKKGADPNQPENELWAVPFAWAERRGYKEIAELLRTFLMRIDDCQTYFLPFPITNLAIKIMLQ